MDNYERLEQKLDKVVEDISKINITLVAQHHNLKEHMRRSQANEQAIEIIKDELIPVQKHVNGLNYVLKAVGVVTVIIGLVTAILKFKDLVL